MAAGSLMVDTEPLIELGSFLETSKTNVSDMLDQLNSKAASLTGCWKDDAGAQFVAKFDSFVTATKEVCTEIETLSAYIKKMGIFYETTLNDYYARLGD